MKTLFNRIRQISPALYYCGLAHFALFVLMLIISQFDHRQLMGINLWTKPIKFALSIAIYSLTWPLFLQYLPFERAKKRFINFSVFALSFEMVCIATQAARGQLSHYNITGIYNSLVFNSMGIVIVLQTLFALYIGSLFFKVKAGQMPAALLWSIRLGIIIAGVFAFVGGIMAYRMAHTVGASDGGPGLPFFNWSRMAGDLRIAHFMGLHALQIVPLFAFFTGFKNAFAVIVFGATYFVLVSLLLYDAMQGRPLF
jgi:hypothetical protein